jgi:hypothetical protein
MLRAPIFARTLLRPRAVCSLFSTQQPLPPPPRAYAEGASSALSLKDVLSPRALFIKVKELGPTALALYGVLWAGPAAITYGAVVSEAFTVADPLQLADTYLPESAVGFFRSTVGSFGLELPAKGEMLSKQTSGLLWGLLVTDLLEPVRIALTLILTQRILAARK